MKDNTPMEDPLDEAELQKKIDAYLDEYAAILVDHFLEQHESRRRQEQAALLLGEKAPDSESQKGLER